MKMKLSEVIEQGWEGREKIEGRYLQIDDGHITGCCAIGAAMVSCLGEDEALRLWRSQEHFDMVVRVGECIGRDLMLPEPVGTLHNRITELNDCKVTDKNDVLNYLREQGL